MLPFYRRPSTINGTLSIFCGLLIKADTHKIQFSEEAYQIIYDGSSPDVQRKLKNAHSVIDNLRRKGIDDW